MKKVLALILAAGLSSSAMANGDVILGVILGTVIGSVSRPNPPVVVQQQPQIIYQPPPPVVVQPTYSCPPGTRQFWRSGWVQNQYGQWIQVSYLECNS